MGWAQMGCHHKVVVQYQGQRRVRILPTPDGSSPFKEVWYHELQVGGKWQKFYDPGKNDNERSPLNEVYDELMATGKESDKELAKQYKSRKFYIVKVVDRDAEEEGVKFARSAGEDDAVDADADQFAQVAAECVLIEGEFVRERRGRIGKNAAIGFSGKHAEIGSTGLRVVKAWLNPLRHAATSALLLKSPGWRRPGNRPLGFIFA